MSHDLLDQPELNDSARNGSGTQDADWSDFLSSVWTENSHVNPYYLVITGEGAGGGGFESSSAAPGRSGEKARDVSTPVPYDPEDVVITPWGLPPGVGIGRSPAATERSGSGTKAGDLSNGLPDLETIVITSEGEGDGWASSSPAPGRSGRGEKARDVSPPLSVEQGDVTVTPGAVRPGVGAGRSPAASASERSDSGPIPSEAVPGSTGSGKTSAVESILPNVFPGLRGVKEGAEVIGDGVKQSILPNFFPGLRGVKEGAEVIGDGVKQSILPNFFPGLKGVKEGTEANGEGVKDSLLPNVIPGLKGVKAAAELILEGMKDSILPTVTPAVDAGVDAIEVLKDVALGPIGKAAAEKIGEGLKDSVLPVVSPAVEAGVDAVGVMKDMAVGPAGKAVLERVGKVPIDAMILPELSPLSGPLSPLHGIKLGEREQAFIKGFAKGVMQGLVPFRPFRLPPVEDAPKDGKQTTPATKNEVKAYDVQKPAKPGQPPEDKNAMSRPVPEDAPKDGKEAMHATMNELKAYDVQKPAKPAQPHEDKNAMNTPVPEGEKPLGKVSGAVRAVDEIIGKAAHGDAKRESEETKIPKKYPQPFRRNRSYR